MKQNSAKLILDLSSSSKEEIAEFFLALLKAKQILLKKGLKVKVSKKRKPSLKKI